MQSDQTLQFVGKVGAPLVRLLSQRGMKIVGLADVHGAIHVPEGISGDEICKKLRVEHGYVLGGGQEKLAGKIIRIGTMGDVSQTDVLAMLGALEMELLSAGLKIQAGAGVQAEKKPHESSSLGARPVASTRCQPPSSQTSATAWKSCGSSCQA